LGIVPASPELRDITAASIKGDMHSKQLLGWFGPKDSYGFHVSPESDNIDDSIEHNQWWLIV
jgi:hypothetical protein